MNQHYLKFNDSLFQALQRGAEDAVLASAAASDNSTVLDGQGTLVVQVTLAQRALPAAGVTVRVSDTDDPPKLLAERITDNSGKTEPIPLSAPSRSYSQSPNYAIQPYSTYTITVDAPGYYTETAVHVPIFDGINSIQPVSLIPLSESGAPRPGIVIDETNSSRL